VVVSSAHQLPLFFRLRACTIIAGRRQNASEVQHQDDGTRFVFDYALRNARKKVTVVHKANVLKALSGVFLEVGHEVARKYEGRVMKDDRIVDATAMQLVMNPWQFDVIVTTNLFGDILSDQLAGLVGGLGMAPGAKYRAGCRDIRGRARLGARYRRQGYRQSPRFAAGGRADAGAH
jgi:hypothetical protein